MADGVARVSEWSIARLRPRSVASVAIWVVASVLLLSGGVAAFGSVDTDAPPEQACTGAAAFQWARTDLEPCHSDALSQFVGGVVFAVVGALVLAVAVGLGRRNRTTVLSPVAGPMAVASPATRQSLRRLGVRSALLLVTGTVLLIGFAVGATWLESRAIDFGARSARTSGSVVGIGLPWHREVFADAITIEYSVSGRTRTATVYMNSSSPSYTLGSSVEVLYLPDDPSKATIRGEDNEPPALVWPMVVAIVGGALAFASGVLWAVRVRRWRRCLLLHPWIPSLVRFYVSHGRRSSFWLLELPEGTVLRLIGVSDRKVNEVLRGSADVDVIVWLAGSEHVEMVVGCDDGAIVAGAVPARTSRQRLRWAEAIADAEIEATTNPDGVPPLARDSGVGTATRSVGSSHGGLSPHLVSRKHFTSARPEVLGGPVTRVNRRC